MMHPPTAPGGCRKIVVIAAATAVVKPVSNSPNPRPFQSYLSNGMENHDKWVQIWKIVMVCFKTP